MITRKNALIFEQILSILWGKVMEIGIENKYVDTGAQRINPISTATSESSFRVIVMSSLAYPYFKCDFEHDATNPCFSRWINDFAPFCCFPVILE